MKYLSDKLPLIVSGIAAIVLLVFAYGCEPTTQSLMNPTMKVTSAELEIEMQTFMATAKIRQLDLTRKAEFKQMLFEQTIIIAQSGSINPIGVIMSLLSILGVGATIDDIRLRKKQKKEIDKP